MRESGQDQRQDSVARLCRNMESFGKGSYHYSSLGILSDYDGEKTTFYVPVVCVLHLPRVDQHRNINKWQYPTFYNENTCITPVRIVFVVHDNMRFTWSNDTTKVEAGGLRLMVVLRIDKDMVQSFWVQGVESIGLSSN